MTRLEGLIAEIGAEFPGFRLARKEDSAFMRAASAFLFFVSLGTQRTFMTSYVTTVGNTVWVPSTWDTWSEIGKVVILRHERVHLRQQRQYGRVLFTVLYALPFLPMFLAYFRARFEMEAYAESIRADAELRGTEHVLSKDYRAWMASQFTGGAYGFMWPFRRTVDRWIMDAVEKAVAERQALEEKKS